MNWKEDFEIYQSHIVLGWDLFILLGSKSTFYSGILVAVFVMERLYLLITHTCGATARTLVLKFLNSEFYDYGYC